MIKFYNITNNFQKAGYFSTSKEKFTSKVTTIITDYHFVVYVSFKLVAYKGVGGPDSFILLQDRTSEQTVVRQSKEFPYLETSSREFDVNITWLLKQFNVDSLATG